MNLPIFFKPEAAVEMGLALSRFVKMLFARKEMRILMVGLDAAGKTTILYKLKLGEIVTTIPTIGTYSLLIITYDLVLQLLRRQSFYNHVDHAILNWKIHFFTSKLWQILLSSKYMGILMCYQRGWLINTPIPLFCQK